MAAIIHYVERRGATVAPLCGDGRTAVNWTTLREVVTCAECALRLAGGLGARRRLREVAPAHGEGDRPGE
jgi:hypothetical protein